MKKEAIHDDEPRLTGSQELRNGLPAAATKHARLETYRQQLTAGRPASATVGPNAAPAAVILEALAGASHSGRGRHRAGLRLPRYFLLEQRAVQVVAALRRVPRGERSATGGWWRSWSASWP